MSIPKVLIHVSGGVADFAVLGDVEIAYVDEDNIDAGDPPVELDSTWRPVLEGRFNIPTSKYVTITDVEPECELKRSGSPLKAEVQVSKMKPH